MSNSTSDTSLQLFVDMSVALTGFDKDILQPPLDPVGLAKIYFDTATAETAGSVYKLSDLLGTYAPIRTQPAQKVADALLQVGLPATAQAYLAQTIIRLWYLGSWYPPGPPTQPPADPKMVVTSSGYVGGLVWKIAQAHPMGYSEFTFGYWSSPPPPLKEFGASGDAGNGGNHG